jgi:hypothetical protein
MNCLNGELFKCPSPRNGEVRLTRTACGMKWEIANTDRIPRLRSKRDVGSVKLEATRGPCRGCEVGRAIILVRSFVDPAVSVNNMVETPEIEKRRWEEIRRAMIEMSKGEPPSVSAPKPIEPKLPKAHKVCIDCGADLTGSAPKRKRCRSCAAAENRRAARGRYADKRLGAR